MEQNPGAESVASKSLTESLLQAAWDSAEVPESGYIEPGQRYIASSGGGNFYTSRAVTRMTASRLVVWERRLI